MDVSNPEHEEADRLAKEMPPLIDKLHMEYNKYFNGAERKPPIQLRDQVEKKMDRLRSVLKQTQAHGAAFRLQNVINKYNTYKALWEKKMLDFEQGKR